LKSRSGNTKGIEEASTEGRNSLGAVSAIREEFGQKRKSDSVLDGHVRESTKRSGKFFFNEERNVLSAIREELGRKRKSDSVLDDNTSESGKIRSMKTKRPSPSPPNTEIDSDIKMDDFWNYNLISLTSGVDDHIDINNLMSLFNDDNEMDDFFSQFDDVQELSKLPNQMVSGQKHKSGSVLEDAPADPRVVYTAD
jgi:hypothetical protein